MILITFKAKFFISVVDQGYTKVHVIFGYSLIRRSIHMSLDSIERVVELRYLLVLIELELHLVTIAADRLI